MTRHPDSALKRLPLEVGQGNSLRQLDTLMEPNNSTRLCPAFGDSSSLLCDSLSSWLTMPWSHRTSGQCLEHARSHAGPWHRRLSQPATLSLLSPTLSPNPLRSNQCPEGWSHHCPQSLERERANPVFATSWGDSNYSKRYQETL